MRISFASVLICLLAVLAGGCATQRSPQTAGDAQVSVLTLPPGALEAYGLAFLTPSTVTGQEEDKQSLAQSFVEAVVRARPGLRPVSLPVALTAINGAGLAGEYKQLLEDYRLTGVLNREGIARIGQAVGARYLAQLKLASFRQESKSRFGALGLRIFDTKSTTVRLFLQVWDSRDGAIVWEGAVELTLAYDSVSEETATFDSVIAASARQLIERLP